MEPLAIHPYTKRSLKGHNEHTAMCGQCLRRPPPHAQLLAALEYQAPLESLMYQFKFGQRLDIGLVLAKCFYHYLLQQQRQHWPDYLIPVPLHPKRLRERGYNQAALLCTHLSRWLSIPKDLHSCRRIRHTQAQTLIAPKARRRNMQGAFSVSSRFRASHVAIIDDVYTSGSTTRELTHVLKRAGVETIEIWVIARAGLGKRKPESL
jgi:ComF family protein